MFGQNRLAEFIGFLSGFNNRKFAFELSFFQEPEKKTASNPFLSLLLLFSTLDWGATAFAPIPFFRDLSAKASA